MITAAYERELLLMIRCACLKLSWQSNLSEEELTIIVFRIAVVIVVTTIAHPVLVCLSATTVDLIISFVSEFVSNPPPFLSLMQSFVFVAVALVPVTK